MFWIGVLIGAMVGSAVTILVVCICMTGGDSDVERICYVSETDYNELYGLSTERIAYLKSELAKAEAENAELRAGTFLDIHQGFVDYFGTYTDNAEVKITDVFKLLNKIETEIWEKNT